MSKDSKVCIGCKKDQLLSMFWNDKNSPGGKVARCKECHASGITSGKRFITSQKPKIPDEIINNEIDFDFLADFKRTSKLGWQLNEIKLLLVKVKEATQNQITNFEKIFHAYGSGHKKSGCLQVLAEIKKLSIHNRELVKNGEPPISLEEYWKTRMFKFGNEELAPAIKNGKKYKK